MDKYSLFVLLIFPLCGVIVYFSSLPLCWAHFSVTHPFLYPGAVRMIITLESTELLLLPTTVIKLVTLEDVTPPPSVDKVTHDNISLLLCPLIFQDGFIKIFLGGKHKQNN